MISPQERSFFVDISSQNVNNISENVKNILQDVSPNTRSCPQTHVIRLLHFLQMFVHYTEKQTKPDQIAES